MLAGLLAAVFVVFGVFLVWAWTGQDAVAAEGEPVSYVEYTWNDDAGKLIPDEKTVSDYTKIEASTDTSAGTTWGTDGSVSWYVVDSPVMIESRVTVSGDVHLVLVDGASLTVNDGIGVPEGASFTVYGQTQSEDTTPGSLTATANNGDAGIGVTKTTNNAGNAGVITIHGGQVTATGGNYAAGIGGGTAGSVDSIVIHGGEVTAKGGYFGAGIGSGAGTGASVDSIVLYGGQVTATGNLFGAAGIGGGSGGSAGSIAIHGGQVTATGGNYAAGIGGGTAGSVDSIVIHGGEVTAKGGSSGAGIGSGYGDASYDSSLGSSVGSVVIHGGVIDATGSDDSSGSNAGEAIGTSGPDASISELVIDGGYFKLTAGSDAVALNAGATVSGGVFAEGTAAVLTSDGSDSQGAVYGVTPAAGFYVVANTDATLASGYPYAVVSIETGTDPGVEGRGEGVTSGGDEGTTGDTTSGSSDGLANTGISVNLFALLGLAVLAALGGLTIAARKRG